MYDLQRIAHRKGRPFSLLIHVLADKKHILIRKPRQPCALAHNCVLLANHALIAEITSMSDSGMANGDWFEENLRW